MQNMYDKDCRHYYETQSNDRPGAYTIRKCDLENFDNGDCSFCRYSSIQRPHTNDSDMRKYLESIGF